LRTDADTDGNGCGIAKRYAYRDGNSDRYRNSNRDGNSNRNRDSDSNTDAHAYADAKSYAVAQTSADPAAETIVGHITN
jgi:hypothetical protein